jgi:hypothetical protein
MLGLSSVLLLLGKKKIVSTVSSTWFSYSPAPAWWSCADQDLKENKLVPAWEVPFLVLLTTETVIWPWSGGGLITHG